MLALKRTFLSAVALCFAAASGLSGALENSSASDLDKVVLAKLEFDPDTAFYSAKLTDLSTAFKFNVTNTWTNEITIDRVVTSCGCTVASLPASPWHIPPGGHGVVNATVNLEGKGAGLMKKTLTFYIAVNTVYVGTRVCTVMVNIPTPPAPAMLTAAERKAAMEKAKAEPRRIFTDPKCAACHVERGRNKVGANLYAADCAICHDSPNRDSAVPDLRALKFATDFDYWKMLITFGKPHTMMPAFASDRGGPLSDDQIHTLAQFLNHTMPSSLSLAHAATNAAAGP